MLIQAIDEMLVAEATVGVLSSASSCLPSRRGLIKVLCRIGKVAGLEPTENAGRHYLSQLNEPWLLIIDNADDRSLDLESLFPSSEDAHILITTRCPDFRAHGSLGALELKGLREDEALQLLLTKADIPGPWDMPTREAGNLITKTLGYLALAVIQAGNCIYRRRHTRRETKRGLRANVGRNRSSGQRKARMILESGKNL